MLPNGTRRVRPVRQRPVSALSPRVVKAPARLSLATGSVLFLAACQQAPPPVAQISPACTIGVRGCLPPYPSYVVEAPRGMPTSQRGLFRVQQGDTIVCQ